MSSYSKKDNKELEKEQKEVKYKPEDLIDTDVESEFKEGDKKGFRQQKAGKGGAGGGAGTGTGTDAGGGDPSASSSSAGSSNAMPPSNEDLLKQQSKEKLKPEDLKDTDAEDEFKEGGTEGFRKNSGKARL